MRTHLMNQLEWKNNTRVLYVSIGTGTDLQFIPKNIDLKKRSILLSSTFPLGMAKMSEKMEHKNEFIACTWLGGRFAICG